MKWLFQSNIWQEYDYTRLLDSVENAGVQFSMVDVIPFTNDFVEPIDFVPDLIFGSNRFVDICRVKKYPTFKSFDPVEEFYPHWMWLNQVGSDMTLGEFASIGYTEPMFIKPYREKFFTGRVIENVEDIDKLQLATSFVDKPEDELIRVSVAKNIFREARFYIIDGVPITASVYKENGIGKQYVLPTESPAWGACKAILAARGPIDDAFVMDLGLISKKDSVENWKIVELNNINSSGLYKTDTDAIVKAFMNL